MFPEWVIQADRDVPTGLQFHTLRTMPASIFSALLPIHVPQVRTILRSWFARDPALVIDATAHVGVDTLNWRYLFPTSPIWAYETDEATCQALSSNVSGKDIDVRHDTCLHLTLPPTEDVVTSIVHRARTVLYVDPPWGPSYAQQASVPLRLDGHDAFDWATSYLDKGVTDVVIKVPFNVQAWEGPYTVSKATVYQPSGRVAYGLWRIQSV